MEERITIRISKEEKEVLQELAEAMNASVSDVVRGLLTPLTTKAIAMKKAERIELLRDEVTNKAEWLYENVIVPLVEWGIIDGVTLFVVEYVEYREQSQWDTDFHHRKEYYVERENDKAVMKCLEEEWVEVPGASNTLSKREYKVEYPRAVFEEGAKVLGLNMLYYMRENLMNKLALELGRLRG